MCNLLVSGVDSLKVELHLLVSGVEKINSEYEDSVVIPLFLLPRLGSRGRDPLLVVSIVMPREFSPKLDFVCFLLASS